MSITPLLRHCRAWALGLALACALAGAWASSRPGDRRPARGGGRPEAGPAEAQDVPIRVEPNVSLPPDALDEAATLKGLERLEGYRPKTLSDALHVARLFGQAAAARTMPAPLGEVRFLDLALDDRKSRAYFGEASLINTRTGVRCLVSERGADKGQKERQAHEDQLLAILAELGIPLSYPIRTPDGERAVRHLLEDALANFDLNQTEIEWSAQAFALYLPPRTSWADKFGAHRTFDDLVGELMRRPFDADGRACAGTHLFYSLVLIARVDEQVPVLTGPARQRLRSFLGSNARLAVRSQSAEGWWGPRWYEGPVGSPEEAGAGDAGKVLATGHLVECLMMMPAGDVPPRDCFLRAIRWLQGRLLACGTDDLGPYYCPYSHAGRVVQQLSRPANVPPEVGTRPHPKAPDVERPGLTADLGSDPKAVASVR